MNISTKNLVTKEFLVWVITTGEDVHWRDMVPSHQCSEVLIKIQQYPWDAIVTEENLLNTIPKKTGKIWLIFYEVFVVNTSRGLVSRSKQSCAHGIKPRGNSNNSWSLNHSIYLVSATSSRLPSPEIHDIATSPDHPALVVTPLRTPTASRSSRSGQQPQEIKAGDRIRI